MSAPTPEAQPPTSGMHQLARRLAEQDPSLRLPRRLRLAMTIGPLGGFALILCIAWAVTGAFGTVIWLTGIEIGSFIGFGKFVIFGGVVRDVIMNIFHYVPTTDPPGPWALAATVVYGDIATATVLLANMSVLYRMGSLGRRLAACHASGRQVLRVHPWMRRMAWVGVAVFVAAPFQGTGAVIGTILARILGISWFSTLTATAAGSVAGCAGMAVLGHYARDRVQAIAEHPIVLVVVLALTVGVLVVLGRWFLGQAPSEEAAAALDERAAPPEKPE
ncbi:MAG TPA: small multi-drug export protein [Planctomycetota bacterium]|nr:small multi-drug export protein [Planctomycetota bacterium]